LSNSLLLTSLSNSSSSKKEGTEGEEDGQASQYQQQPAFVETVDLIKNEHLEAARSLIKDQEILYDIEVEIEQECEMLKAFLMAVQVRIWF
jgi:aspartate kinase